MNTNHTFMQKEDKRGKLSGPIIKVATVDWAKHRASGYNFCVADEDFDPAAAYAAQEAKNKQDRSGNAEAAEDAHNRNAEGKAARESDGGDDDDDDEGVSMDNTKAEILAYLESNGVEANEDFTKAELLELIDEIDQE